MAITVVGPAGLGGGKSTVTGQTVQAEAGSRPVAGDIFLTVLALDNGGTDGAPLDSTATFGQGSGSGTVGTVTDLVYNQDPGAAFAGCTLLVAYAEVTADFTANEFLSYSWASATIARAYGYYVISGAATAHVNDNNSLGTGASPTVTTDATPTRAVQNGDLVFGLVAVESATAITTGDTDTLNGSWATFTNQSSGGTGGDASKMSLGLQHKIVTADGDQTYNPAITDTDYAIAVVTFGPAGAPPAERVPRFTSMPQLLAH